MRHKSLGLLLLLLAACVHQQPVPATTAPAATSVTAPAATPATAASESTRRYTVLMSTNRAGTQVVTARGNELTVDYEYNDRGRGPKTHTVIHFNDRFIPTSIHTTGNDYFKSQIEETFTMANGRASWKNPAEEGTANSDGFYVAMQSPPELIGVVAKALLRASGQKLPLLPVGEASIRKAGEVSLGSKRVSHYEIIGADLAPIDVWLDENDDFFAFVFPFQSMIREGYEEHQKTLLDAQDKRSTERLRQIAQRTTKTPRNGTLVVTNARIFDPKTLTTSAPSTIVVRGNRIESVGPSASVTDGEMIDAGGRIVIPGLWDMHSHLSDLDGVLHIAAGVTSVHDVGNDVDTVVSLKERYANGTLVGPRVTMRALIDGPGPLQAPTNLLVSTEDEARAVIDRLVARGFEGIKIYSSIKPELIPFMTKYAHDKGLRASGHIPAGMTASQAIDAGYDEIHHINMLFLNFWPEVKETNSPLRFTAVGDRGPDLDLQSSEVQSFIAKLKATDTTVDPTLVVFEWIFVSRPGVMTPSYAAIADRLPPQFRRYLSAGGGLPVTKENDARYIAAFRKMLDFTRELHRRGVRVVAGTDQYAGIALHRELELYAQAGIPNAEVLRIGTWHPVQMLGLEKDLGSVEAGKLADFVILDGDPLRNMGEIKNVRTVVKDGKVFDSKALYGEVGIR